MKGEVEYQDKVKLRPTDMQQLVTKNLPKMIVMNARLEDVKTSEQAVKEVLKMSIGNSLHEQDYDVVAQLRLAWKMILDAKDKLNLALEQRVNTIVDLDNAFPGMIRNGSGSIITDRGEFIPPEINEKQEAAYLNDLLASSKTVTDKALTLMYHNMREQIFYDGNKRTAFLIANKLMIDHGAGLICIPLAKFKTWMNKLTSFYFSNDMTEIKNWTYQNGIIKGA